MNPRLYSLIIKIEIEAARECMTDGDFTLELSEKAAQLPHGLTDDELTICKHILKHGESLPSNVDEIRQLIWELGKFHAMQTFKNMLTAASSTQLLDETAMGDAGTSGIKPLEPHMQQIIRQARNS